MNFEISKCKVAHSSPPIWLNHLLNPILYVVCVDYPVSHVVRDWRTKYLATLNTIIRHSVLHFSLRS